MSKVVKTVQIKKRIIPARSKTVETVSCDICGKSNGDIGKCVLCGRDCHKWVYGSSEQCSEYDPRDYGDYPSRYCNYCYELKFVKYDKEYHKIQDDCYKAEEALGAKILAESKEL